MAFLNKEYKLDKEDNFGAFLRAVGLPDPLIEKYLSFKPTSKLVQSGDTYTYISSTPDGVRDCSFKSGVEFDDEIQNIPVKTTYTVDGNVVTQSITADKGSTVIKREYNGDDLDVTITSSVWDGIAKRYYKA